MTLEEAALRIINEIVEEGKEEEWEVQPEAFKLLTNYCASEKIETTPEELISVIAQCYGSTPANVLAPE